jgi:Tol biopolymer transport system component
MTTIARATLVAGILAGSAQSATQITTTGGLNPDWSPNGEWLVYEDAADIWRISSSGGTPIQLTTDIAADVTPVWSPDGTYILFTSSRLGTDNIHRIALPGGTITPFIGGPAEERYPTFSPDGRQVAFASDRGGDWDIWVRDLDLGTDTQITFDAEQEQDLDWSPDGMWIAYRLGVANASISAVSAAGGAPIVVVDGPEVEGNPTWNWDSQSLAFESYQSGEWNVYTVPFPSGLPASLVADPTYFEFMPAWSPHGDRLAYVSTETGVYEIFTLDNILSSPASEAPAMPTVTLHNAPNPFRATTRLFASFDGSRSRTDVDAAGAPVFRIFDAEGRRVRELRGMASSLGAEVSWDGRNAAGVTLPNGVYFFRLTTTDGASAAGRAILRR